MVPRWRDGEGEWYQDWGKHMTDRAHDCTVMGSERMGLKYHFLAGMLIKMQSKNWNIYSTKKRE